MCLIFSVLLFLNLFENMFVAVILVMQSTILMYYIIRLLIYIIKKYFFSKETYKIKKEDKEKFRYYRKS